MLTELTYIFEIVAIFAAFYSTYRISKRKNKMFCSYLMAVGTTFIGLYVIL